MKTVVDQFAEDIPILTGAFGTPSDVDGDGKMAVLFTHLIHDLGRWVLFRATSVVPAESGGDGNMADLLWLSPVRSERYRPLLAHYFQHLINFNQHVLVRRSSTESIWLNEGLSHVAQDLVAEQDNLNYRYVRSFLRQPGAVGLNTATDFSPWRGGGLPVRAQPCRSAGGGGAAAPGTDRSDRRRQCRGGHRGVLCRRNGPLGGAALHQRYRAERTTRASTTGLPPCRLRREGAFPCRPR